MGSKKRGRKSEKSELKKKKPEFRLEYSYGVWGLKEQVLRSWKIWKTGGAFTTPFPPGTRPGGGGSKG